jgi:hypothetical protein
MHAEQMHLLTEPAPATARAATVIETEHGHRITDTTTPVPVLYRCLACERQTKRRRLWRSTHQRRIVHTSWWNPSVRKQVDIRQYTWTTTDGRTYNGEHPPAEPCSSCRRPTSGETIRGRFSAGKPCGARCIFAKGPNCECSCAGANHGIGHTR